VDGLKNSKSKDNGKAVGVLARQAIRWAQESLQENSVRGQKREETIDKGSIGDDSILACCMYNPVLRSDLQVS
jgi:PIN domain